MDRWWLSKLPDHLPLIVGSAVVFQLGTLLFSYLFSTTRKLPNDKEDKDPVFRRMQWGVNSVSLLHALIVSWMAIGVQQDPKLRADPLFGYSRTAGDLFAISCGYFLWDTLISIRFIKHYGVGFVLHAAFSLLVYLFSYGPFLMWYGAGFLLFEWSTIFLYINWFLDKFNMTGSVYQMVNGVVLIVVFFVVRLYYGVQISWQFYQDILFSQHSPKIPVVLKVLYCTANVILMSLNVVWFRKLIASLLKRVVVKRNKD